PFNPSRLYNAAYQAAGRSETKLVRSPSVSNPNVPPTICFTFPSCKSIHGRNICSKLGFTNQSAKFKVGEYVSSQAPNRFPSLLLILRLPRATAHFRPGRQAGAALHLSQPMVGDRLKSR